jgi:hypothetical protein
VSPEELAKLKQLIADQEAKSTAAGLKGKHS